MLWCARRSPGELVTPILIDSVGLEWVQRRYISNKLPGNTYDRGLIRFRDLKKIFFKLEFYLFIYFIFGCVGPSLLRAGFL